MLLARYIGVPFAFRLLGHGRRSIRHLHAAAVCVYLCALEMPSRSQSLGLVGAKRFYEVQTFRAFRYAPRCERVCTWTRRNVQSWAAEAGSMTAFAVTSVESPKQSSSGPGGGRIAVPKRQSRTS